jgi:ABC-type amino acid transport substrate-binding protein
MKNMKIRSTCLAAILCLFVCVSRAAGDELSDLKASGQLRHLGVCYANFVTGTGDGLDVELMQCYAKYLGVNYQYIREDWKNVIPSLTGVEYTNNDPNLAVVRQGVIANGMTLLPWREKLVAFSTPTFPTQVWLVARADSQVRPITPSGDIKTDIAAVKEAMKGRQVLCKVNTCLDPNLYALDKTGADIKLFAGGLNELAPAVILDEAEMTILDVPDALIALDKWPGKLKIIGPVSLEQSMAVAFPKEAAALRDSFNQFFAEYCKNGAYVALVQKYYPAVFRYYPEFFKTLERNSKNIAVNVKP